MKKFLLGLMAFVGMAVCFTACGDKEDNPTPKQEKTADESGVILYNSYITYNENKDKTDDPLAIAASVKAAADLYQAYQAYQNNKDSQDWKNEFAKSAAKTAVEDKYGIDVENKTELEEGIKTALLASLSEENAQKVQTGQELYEILNTVF